MTVADYEFHCPGCGCLVLRSCSRARSSRSREAAMSTASAEKRYARCLSAARLLGVRDLPDPFGRVSISPAGSTMEAASEDTTSKSKSCVIEVLILETEDKNDGPLSMVNEYGYWSVSRGRSASEINQRKRPHPERPQVSVFSLLSMAAEPLRRETTATQRLAEIAITSGAVLKLAGVSQPLMCRQRKWPPLGTAASRWDQGPSRRNDTIRRNNRVHPEVVRAFAVCHPPDC